MLAGEVGSRGSTEAARAAETMAAALAVLRKSISVDVHSHGGRAGITTKAPHGDDLANSSAHRSSIGQNGHVCGYRLNQGALYESPNGADLPRRTRQHWP